MSFALLLRHRRFQLLMQRDPAKRKSSRPLAARLRTPLKRSASSAAASLKVEEDPQSSKLARLGGRESADKTSSLPESRRTGEQFHLLGSHESRTGNPYYPKPDPAREHLGKRKKNKDTLSEPLMDEKYSEQLYAGIAFAVDLKGSGFSNRWKEIPKSALGNFFSSKLKRSPHFEFESGTLQGRQIFRAKVQVTEDVVGIGDGTSKKEAEKAAALAACYEILSKRLHKKELDPESSASVTKVTLTDGSEVEYDLAKQFMEYYCRKFRFGQPLIEYTTIGKGGRNWEAIMTVGGRRIGIGTAGNKKDAMKNCYLDVVVYLEKCDPGLWREFIKKAKIGKDLGLVQVYMRMSAHLKDDIWDLNQQVRTSTLYRNKPEASVLGKDDSALDPLSSRGPYRYPTSELRAKSAELLKRRQAYLSNPTHEIMRSARNSLPIYTKADDILKHIEDNEVTILMAATGSGKTTQVPQLILDSFIDSNEGATCNIFCTQPRRLAAISVAQRVAKERGEPVGRNGSIGYQVRFQADLPDQNGSVTFCTIGVFLRRMQAALQRGYDKVLDNATHIIVDEVHERDVDTDLLLAVLKRLLEVRRQKGNPLKVILMSATVDATLFQNYFPDSAGKPASLIEVPGRTFPVKRRFLDEFLPSMIRQNDTFRWVFFDEKVMKYIHREVPDLVNLLPNPSSLSQSSERGEDQEEELEIPYPLVGMVISYVLQNSDSGHVLVFLPGWEEIQGVKQVLLSSDNLRMFGLDFNDTSRYSLHILHSAVPLAEQQIIFDPPPDGVRRIILSTNIAETSVTIPDVVYVVDTAKIKENQYDPERHISSLVSAWVGKSNLNQRAGRAGRHRPGEYFGMLSSQRADSLHSHQTVEMKRSDLSNVVMHVKALDFPDMNAEEVLARTIEPPAAERVSAAIDNLKMVGALDERKNLTSLGRILLQLPIDVQLGRLVLYGSLFKCLDQALTLAAIFSIRDPFLSPPLKRKEAQAAKESWCPDDFRSDALAALRAFNAWHELEERGDSAGATRLCTDNFLSRPTLLMAAKVKRHLLEHLEQAGILDVSTTGRSNLDSGPISAVPPELNINNDSLPSLAALIAIASQPKFAIRVSPAIYRTAIDRGTIMHTSSVNRKGHAHDDIPASRERHIFAYSEKRQNLSLVGRGPGQMTLLGTTRLDPMTYVLFGASSLEALNMGLECDGWIQVIGDVEALHELRRLKLLMESCMLRVFESIDNSNSIGPQRSKQAPTAPSKYIPPALRYSRDVIGNESGDEDTLNESRGPLSDDEANQLNKFTQEIVHILNKFADEERTRSRLNSQLATPTSTPSTILKSLSGSGWRSGASTPLRHESRPSTPAWLLAKGGW